MACLQVPAAGEKNLPLLFRNGIVKIDGEKEPLPRPKTWPLGNILAPGALSIPNSWIIGGSYEDEDGELTKSEDREFRIQAERGKRIVWDMERRCYLDAAAVAVLQRLIAERRCWPVELCRVSTAPPGKGKASKADKGDEAQISFHGVAYVNMLPLLCPGVKEIRGAFRVFSYQDSEVFEKTKSQHSIFQELRAHLNLIKEGLGTPSLSRPPPSKAQKEDKDSNRMLHNPSKIQLSDGTGGSENIRTRSVDGQQYTEAGTFLVMEIKLDKALVPKRLREELTRCIKEMIPSRPALPAWTEGAKKVVEDYHKRVTSIATAILSEYHKRFGKQLSDHGAIDHETLEEQKRQLNYELNTSGKYFAFKEQLKYAVVKIVREKYLKTTAFETQEQLQAFLSELYVYLVEQMHVAVNQARRNLGDLGHDFTLDPGQLLSEEGASPAPPSRTTQEQLWLFAREAEANKDYKLASLYHQQRIAQDRRNIQSWLDYGAFCLLHEDTTKAQECFQQALSVDLQHIQSLLLCGIGAVMLQHYEDAEVFFEDACCLEPSSIVAWTLSGLFYELQNNNIQAERNFREAKKLLQAQLSEERRISDASEGGEGRKDISPITDPEEFLPEGVSDGSADKLPEVVEPALACVTSKEETTALEAAPEAPSLGSGPQQPPCTIFMKAVEFLMKVNAVQFVHQALAHELLSPHGGPTCAYHLALAWTYLLQEDFPRCEECLCEAIRIDCTNPNVWAQKGHLCYLKGDFGKAKECYERVVSFVEDALDMHFVYLRLGSIYLEEREYGRAKQIYLLACDNSASCLTWLGVGIACYRVSAAASMSSVLQSVPWHGTQGLLLHDPLDLSKAWLPVPQCSQRPLCPVHCYSPSMAPVLLVWAVLWEQHPSSHPSSCQNLLPQGVMTSNLGSAPNAYLHMACMSPLQLSGMSAGRNLSAFPRESITSEGCQGHPASRSMVSPRGAPHQVPPREFGPGKGLELLFPPWPNVYFMGGCGIGPGR
ncbi:cilia- and flagella-associated protein 70 isoform X1 [Pithys albifrons albifrons]|uniref:cilia- and flagella-associated protein 70 isoform X1 n=1 Tax=Pithys albifrons albifrons TaxID=3385563 RepID=UPI003A5CD454